jgi:hypothetical protein
MAMDLGSWGNLDCTLSCSGAGHLDLLWAGMVQVWGSLRGCLKHCQTFSPTSGTCKRVSWWGKEGKGERKDDNGEGRVRCQRWNWEFPYTTCCNSMTDAARQSTVDCCPSYPILIKPPCVPQPHARSFPPKSQMSPLTYCHTSNASAGPVVLPAHWHVS